MSDIIVCVRKRSHKNDHIEQIQLEKESTRARVKRHRKSMRRQTSNDIVPAWILLFYFLVFDGEESPEAHYRGDRIIFHRNSHFNGEASAKEARRNKYKEKPAGVRRLFKLDSLSLLPHPPPSSSSRKIRVFN